MRGIKKAKFIEDLQTGRLAPILETAKDDESICLEIRNNYFNIYYKGGNLLKLEAVSDHYKASFDAKYAKKNRYELESKLPSDRIDSEQDLRFWLKWFPDLKKIMEQYWQEHPNQEREAQQRMVADNNFGPNCRSTDYYICDIEYEVPKAYQYHKKPRFDMVGLRWSNNESHQANQSSHRLVVFEVKHGDGSLTGKSGLQKHAQDIDDFLGIESNLKTFKSEMTGVFNQKRKLGLIDCDRDLQGFNDDRPLVIFTLVNLDLDNRKLQKVLAKLPDYANVEIRITICGPDEYGLFDRNVFKLN